VGTARARARNRTAIFFYLWLSSSPTPPPCVSSRDFAAGYGPEPASQPATVRPARRNSRRHSRLGIRCLWLTPCRAAGGGAGSLVRRRRYAGGWCHPPPALLRPRFRPASPRRTGRWLGVTSPHARTGRRARRQARLRQDPAEVDWSRPRRAPPCTPLVVVGRPARAVTSRPRPLPSHPSGFRKYLRCGRSKRAGKDDPS